MLKRPMLHKNLREEVIENFVINDESNGMQQKIHHEFEKKYQILSCLR